MKLRPFVAAALLALGSGSCATDDGDDADRHLGTAVSALGDPANTQQCGSAYVEGLDVYNGTGTIDWAKVKTSGRDFAFIKATQGTYNKQSTFAANWAGAGSNGILRSAYHFFDPTDDGSAQATAFLGELATVGGMTDADLPPLVDIECPVSSVQSTATSEGSGCEYAGNSGWVATATMQQRIFDFLAIVEAATHRKPLLYSYPSWFGDVKFTDPRLTNYPLFIATYATCASIPPPFTIATFWQYSATTTVSGISGTNNVDVDRFFGSAADLSAWNEASIERDAGVDAGAPDDADAGPADGGVDPDGGLSKKSGSGCDCEAGGRGAPGALLFAAVVLAIVRRRNLR